MITPMRLGLKYAPVPTLALEYEDDQIGVEDVGVTSLFVLREGDGEAPRRRTKKLHVVELPTLSRSSETRRIVEQLQRDNSKFLSPSVVSQSQLTRLLDLLVEHLAAVEAGSERMEQGDGKPTTKTSSVLDAPVVRESVDREEGEEEEHDEADESFIEDSVAESSQALESSGALSDDGREHVDPPSAAPALSASRGTFLSQEDDESEDEQLDAGDAESEGKSRADTLPAGGGLDEGDDYDDGEASRADKAVAASNSHASAAVDDLEKRKDEADEEEKKKALKSGSEVSDEDIQSEDLEYFSEDGSEEESF